MNGPKVRQVLKSVPVSEKAVHTLISRFLEREGQEEVMLHENLTRLQTICQSFGRASKSHEDIDNVHSLAAVAPSTPSVKKDEPPVVDMESRKKDKVAKSAEKEAKKSAKKERKEKRKRDRTDTGEKKKRQKSGDS